MRQNYGAYVAANSNYNYLLKTAPAAKVEIATAKGNADGAFAAYNLASAQARAFAANGHYGDEVQRVAQSMEQDAQRMGALGQDGNAGTPPSMSLTPPTSTSPAVSGPTLTPPTPTSPQSNTSGFNFNTPSLNGMDQFLPQ